MKELSNRKKIVISCTDIVEKESVDDTEVYYFNGKKLDKKANGKTEIELAKEKITEIINKFLGRQYENTIVLTGAGSSILKETDINEEIDEGINISDHSGKTVAELKTEIEKHLNDIPNVFSLDEPAKKVKYLLEEVFNGLPT
ncbi:hypothetical protein [Anoxybacillus sp. ST4]|uniref:hypothetical protein n=1 Tax=Anoxybacillus sp. ST4 TaxID=2864181 RepID=UPI001C63F327|nr:hypothetical protein [Anoxybacillus sp. ST4]MBW7650865.1 hypothetical protein [Anoxybacillus sp. ST4]